MTERDRSLSVEQYARSMAHDALDALASVIDLESGAKDSDRISAAREILDRGHGKPTQAIISVPARVATRAALAAMSNEELLAAIGELRLKSRGGYTGGSPIGAGRDRLETAQHSTQQAVFRAPRKADSQMLLISKQEITEAEFSTGDVFKEGPPALSIEFDVEIDPLCL